MGSPLDGDLALEGHHRGQPARRRYHAELFVSTDRPAHERGELEHLRGAGVRYCSGDREVLTLTTLAVIPVSAISVVAGARFERATFAL